MPRAVIKKIQISQLHPRSTKLECGGLCISTSSKGTPGEVQLSLGTTGLGVQSSDSTPIDHLLQSVLHIYWPLTYDKALGLSDPQFFFSYVKWG